MLKDLDIIKNTYEVKYAPAEWKKTYMGWDLDDQINQAKSLIQIAGPLTVKDYQKILHAFFISMNDYHVHESYFSTELAILPFTVSGVNGKYFFSEVHRELLEVMLEFGLYKGAEIPEVGNEILIFDSQPVYDAVQDVKFREVGNSDSKTTEAIAESFLTKRLGALGHRVPEGINCIQFINNGGQLIEAEIEWFYNPESIASKSNKVKTQDKKTKRFGKVMINPTAQKLKGDFSQVYKKILGKRLKGKMNSAEIETKATKALDTTSLTLGKIIWKWKPNSLFDAYIYQLPNSKKRIAYIRLDTFYPSSDPEIVNAFAAEFAELVSFFQSKSDALVINQVDNPGGWVFYVYGIASMLSDKPLAVPAHRLCITQEDVAEAIDDLDGGLDDQKNNEEDDVDIITAMPGQENEIILGYAIDDNFEKGLKDFSEFIINEWNAGKTCTSLVYPYGVERLTPHPSARYTKPILLIVDKSDFSGADFFPAILQDNKRAIIFGEKTAGAGGFVSTHNYPNQFGLEVYTYTASIAERANGQTIENLGVTPDIAYEITESDFRNGYKGYIKAINKAVEGMLRP